MTQSEKNNEFEPGLEPCSDFIAGFTFSTVSLLAQGKIKPIIKLKGNMRRKVLVISGTRLMYSPGGILKISLMILIK